MPACSRRESDFSEPKDRFEAHEAGRVIGRIDYFVLGGGHRGRHGQHRVGALQLRPGLWAAARWVGLGGRGQT